MGRKRGDSVWSDSAELRKQFEKEDFDTIKFLNEVVPPVAPSTVIQSLPGQSRLKAEPLSANPQSLSQISSMMHKLLSQISVRHTALSNELTQTTDEILRSGGRLEYEVDVLKGDVNGLHEILTERLKGDIERFARQPEAENATTDGELGNLVDPKDAALPPELAQLKMLLTVRNRLEAVVKVFGEESFAKEMAEQRKRSRQ